jgi:glycosyltransferase involved in cell wall biosynthesis
MPNDVQKLQTVNVTTIRPATPKSRWKKLPTELGSELIVFFVRWPSTVSFVLRLLERRMLANNGKKIKHWAKVLVQQAERNYLDRAFEWLTKNPGSIAYLLIAAEINFNLRQHDRARLFLQAAKDSGKQIPSRLMNIHAALVAELDPALAHSIIKDMPDDPLRSLRLAAIHWQKPELWLLNMNEHLTKQGLSPISLKNEENAPIFQRLTSTGNVLVHDGPLVSVSMSCHNSEAWIEQAARSILNQTWKNLELLAFDDCSTDSTFEKLVSLAKTDPRLKVIRNQMNCGTYVNRNQGLRMARGTYFTTQDSDDWAHPQRIELQVRAMIQNQSLVACSTASFRMQETGIIEVRSGGDFIDSTTMATYLFHRQRILETAGYWDCVRAGGDAEFIRRLKVMGMSDFIGAIDHTLVFMLNRDGSLTTTPGLEARHGYTSAARRAYRVEWRKHHASGKSLRLEFSSNRAFKAPEAFLVSKTAIDTAAMESGRYQS